MQLSIPAAQPATAQGEGRGGNTTQSSLRLRTYFLPFVVGFLFLAAHAQSRATFRIAPVRPIAELRAEALKAQPPQENGIFRRPDLVEVNKLGPAIKLDVRYATAN